MGLENRKKGIVQDFLQLTAGPLSLPSLKVMKTLKDGAGCQRTRPGDQSFGTFSPTH